MVGLDRFPGWVVIRMEGILRVQPLDMGGGSDRSGLMLVGVGDLVRFRTLVVG